MRCFSPRCLCIIGWKFPPDKSLHSEAMSRPLERALFRAGNPLRDFTSTRRRAYVLAVFATLGIFSLGVMHGRAAVHAHYTRRYPFVTLHYGARRDARVILHNCVMARRAGQVLTVHTTMARSAYCGVCRCVSLKMSGCHKPTLRKNLCDKLAFVAQAVPRLRAFFFLDSDLLIVHRRFFSALQLRAQSHDWLAAYGHHVRRAYPRYQNRFNTGLFFVRALNGVNYSQLMPMMAAYNSTSDQGVLSDFVLMHYRNWDALSVRFNCRAILRFKDDVPPHHCLAIHDRFEAPALRRMLNLSMLAVGRS